MLRIHSLRFRIAFAYIVGALVVSGGVALGTWFITSWVLSRQAIDSAMTQTYAEVTFLRDQLSDEGEDRLRVYLGVLQQRGSDLIAETEDFPAASTSIGVSEQTIPAQLRREVEGDRVASAIVSGPTHRRVVVGSYVPGTDPRVLTYFFYSLEGVDRTLSLLWRVLVAVVAVAGAVAGAVGLRLADRTIRPLRGAADAARRVAEGHLETRLLEAGEDELARLARDFNRMTRALEERIARERRFVADVSHELRTPLTTLKTSIDYIADRVAELPPRLRSAVGLAADEVRSLGRLVDDLLELTRVEAGGVQVSWEEVDLRAFATEVVRRRAPAVEVSIDGPDELVVRTDKARLERVVGNLVENAVVHGGGRDVRINLESENGLARIVVADRGPGIGDEQLSSIFERFWRGDASRSRDGRSGAGLGLAIARENARLIGADVFVDSVTGEGTRFEVLLPLGAAE